MVNRRSFFRFFAGAAVVPSVEVAANGVSTTEKTFALMGTPICQRCGSALYYQLPTWVQSEREMVQIATCEHCQLAFAFHAPQVAAKVMPIEEGRALAGAWNRESWERRNES